MTAIIGGLSGYVFMGIALATAFDEIELRGEGEMFLSGVVIPFVVSGLSH